VKRVEETMVGKADRAAVCCRGYLPLARKDMPMMTFKKVGERLPHAGRVCFASGTIDPLIHQ